jgi:hypothetical protein
MDSPEGLLQTLLKTETHEDTEFLIDFFGANSQI